MQRLFLTLAALLSLSLTWAQEIETMTVELSDTTVSCDVYELTKTLFPKGDGPAKVAPFRANDGSCVTFRDRILNMPEYLHKFYDRYVQAGQDVLAGKENWLSYPTFADASDANSYYVIVDIVTDQVPFSFPSGSTQTVIKNAASAAVSAATTELYNTFLTFMPYAVLSLNLDHPEFFWIGSETQYGCSTGCTSSFFTYSGVGTATYTMTLKFTIYSTSGFDIRANGVTGSEYNYRDRVTLLNAVQKYKQYKQTILNGCSGSRYDKLLAAHNWLTEHSCYNPYFLQGYQKNQIGGTPWTPISALQGNTGQQAPVCEGYARALKVLCNDMDIPCILMSGNATSSPTMLSEAHMWNYVQMEDGKWYAVDATWDDPVVKNSTAAKSGYESQKWFLLGSETEVEDGFTFIQSHPEDFMNTSNGSNTAAWVLQAGPQLTEKAYGVTPSFDPGDANGDGQITEEDFTLLTNLICEKETEADGNADVNGDGQVTVADLVTLINMIAQQNDHEYVDLGLPSGTLWATCNVGAKTPETAGSFFAWAETEARLSFSQDNCKYMNGYNPTKYYWSDSLSELEAEDDAATANWGSEWQTPSDEQCKELVDGTYTSIYWTSQNNVSGALITSNINGNSIFLPAAGNHNPYTGLTGQGEVVEIWTRTQQPYQYMTGATLKIQSTGIQSAQEPRQSGLNIRPVRKSGN